MVNELKSPAGYIYKLNCIYSVISVFSVRDKMHLAHGNHGIHGNNTEYLLSDFHIGIYSIAEVLVKLITEWEYLNE